MKKTLPHLLVLFLITSVLWANLIQPVESAPPPGWSGDDNLEFRLLINSLSIADPDPIPLDTSGNATLQMSIRSNVNLTVVSGYFTLSYLSIPLINQPVITSPEVMYGGDQTDTPNQTVPLGEILGTGGLSLISGTVAGSLSITYSLNMTAPYTNVTVSDDFVLQLGPTGAAALLSVSGLITVGFTLMSIFGLLLALDDFQQGIFAARKMRGAKRGSDVGIFPAAVVLRRKPKKKKEAEKIDKAELKKRVSEAGKTAWEGKRCPKCGKKWKKDVPQCSKCKIERSAAVTYFSEDIAEYAPKALKVMKPKSKMPVGKFSKRLKLKRVKGGALAAALTDMGVFQTRSVKVPLMKVAMAGMTLSGTYWSWMQILSGAVPSYLDILLSATLGLVISVVIAYFMNWLARVPKLGYD